jgi:DNA polymerase V
MSCIVIGNYEPTSRPAIPFFLERVSAGFPSPAEDYIEKTIDLNELCIQHPAATFFVRVQGDSMVEAGIYPGDVLVVDRSLHAGHGDTIIASLESEMTVKELHTFPLPIRLLPRNPNYQPIVIEGDMVMEVFGVVTNVVRKLRRSRSE